MSRVVVIIADEDPLAAEVGAALASRGVPTRTIRPGALGDCRMTLAGEQFALDGAIVGGILFRSMPQALAAESFPQADQPFCDAELRAILLAAMHLDSVLTLNSYDAVAWTQQARWPLWRRALLAAGLPVTPVIYGESASAGPGRWWPYTTQAEHAAPAAASGRAIGAALPQEASGPASLCICGQVVAGADTARVRQAAAALLDLGVAIAGLTSDQSGRIRSIHSEPQVSDPAHVAGAARIIVERYHAHLSRW